MLELRGKYNTAKVFTDVIDSETISQVTQLMNQKSVEGRQVRIMPDCHAGAGCVIGTTMEITDKVIPNLVGVDIGCGMLTVKVKETFVDYSALDQVIREHIPSGFSIHAWPIAKSNVDQIIAPVNVEQAMCSLGTLGGGNHFIELDRGNDGSTYLVIHTGSRHLGLEVCKHYQELAHRKLRSSHVKAKIDETIEKLKAEGKERDIENTIKILKMQETPIPKDLCYVEDEDFTNYIHDMKLAQEHAKINRRTIADQILKYAGLTEEESFDTIHNYIDTDNMILRKGAISAQKGERVLIPLNMRDGSLICIGKGNPDWNCSAPHGAGRVLSRSQAKERITMDEFNDSMKGIYSTSVTQSTIDESPMAYKPMEAIIDNIGDTVEIVDRITPLYNFKASEA